MLGHGESVVICDADLPVPPGVPGFMVTLETILTEMQVEHHVLVDELQLQLHSRHLTRQIDVLGLPDKRTFPHADFKRMTHSAKAVIRIGECTPYVNIILATGVVF